jgi:hypothetical protein
LAWSVPVILTLIAVNWYLFRTRIPEHMMLSAHTETLPRTKELFVLAGAQYATRRFVRFLLRRIAGI